MIYIGFLMVGYRPVGVQRTTLGRQVCACAASITLGGGLALRLPSLSQRIRHALWPKLRQAACTAVICPPRRRLSVIVHFAAIHKASFGDIVLVLSQGHPGPFQC